MVLDGINILKHFFDGVPDRHQEAEATENGLKLSSILKVESLVAYLPIWRAPRP